MKTWLVLLALALAAPGSQGDDAAPWPQFRGPNGSGVADDAHPPVEIGPDKNVTWKATIPGGASSPIIVGPLLVLTAFENAQLLTIAYRRDDGSEAWRAAAPYAELEPYHKTEGSPAASTPATDGRRIVAYFGSCGLFCYDLQGGELWRREMPPAATISDMGSGVSPIMVDGLVVLLRDERNAPQLLALDAATGRVKWKKKRESISGFSTPVVWDTPGGKQLAAPGYRRLIGYDLASGAEAWFVEGMPAASCTSPVTGDGRLYYAGWAPGDAAEKGAQKVPTYDQLLAHDNADANHDGVFSKEEANATGFKDFFDHNDPNKDGLIDRAEWDKFLQFMAASKNSAFALRPGGQGDCTQSHILWRHTDGLPYVPSAILYRGQFVMVKDGGIVTAYDATSGQRLYRKRAVASGGYYASPVAAGGNIYFTALSDGAVTVLRGGTAKPEVVARNPPLGERISATPAIADDTLYVRTAGHLYAFATEP